MYIVRAAWDAWSAVEHNAGNEKEAVAFLQKSFAIRFRAKGDFTILANNIAEDRTHNA